MLWWTLSFVNVCHSRGAWISQCYSACRHSLPTQPQEFFTERLNTAIHSHSLFMWSFLSANKYYWSIKLKSTKSYSKCYELYAADCFFLRCCLNLINASIYFLQPVLTFRFPISIRVMPRDAHELAQCDYKFKPSLLIWMTTVDLLDIHFPRRASLIITYTATSP